MVVKGNKSVAPIGVAILGFGTVGQGVYDLLAKRPQAVNLRMSQPIEIRKILLQNVNKKRDIDAPMSLFTTDIDDILKDPSIKIVVELIGGVHPAKDYILEVLRAGKHVVTANKAVLAQEGEALFEEAHRMR